MIWLLGIAVALPLAGLLFQALGSRRDAKRCPAPGRLASGLHLDQQGTGKPTIVLEAGIAASSVSWSLVRSELARHTTVLSYDRAGYAWSPAAQTPRSMPNLISELHTMLQASATEGPYVMVGHSFGGLLLRHFATRYPSDVAALVLVDPLEPFESHPLTPQQAYRLEKGVMLSRRGATLAQLGVVRFALDLMMAGAYGIPKLLAKATSGRGSAVPNRLVGEIRKLPRETWPAVKSHWCQPDSFRTMAQYLERLPEYCALPLDDAALRNLPLVVISAEQSSPDVVAAHQKTAALSNLGRHIIAPGSGHWVQLDSPDVVLQAIAAITGLSLEVSR